MEVFFISRGINEQVEKWKKFVESWMLPYPYIDTKDGNKKKVIGYQANLKPIQLWGLTFPHEQRDLVLNSLQLAGKDSNIGFLQKYTAPLRWALKADRIPENIPKMAPKYLAKEFVQLMPIGIKDDVKDHLYADGTIREFL